MAEQGMPPQVVVGQVREGVAVPQVPLTSLLDARLAAIEYALSAQKDSREAMRDAIMAVMNERDRKYGEAAEEAKVALAVALTAQKEALAVALTAQKEATAVALTAQKEQTGALFDAQKEAVAASLSAADRAVNKAEAAAEKRFEAVNEFRGTLQDQQRTLVPRTEYDVTIASIKETITVLTSQVTRQAGTRDGTDKVIPWAISAFALIISIVIYFATHK